MHRQIEKELLDELPSAAPAALSSRKDLRRLNAWMGNARTASRELRRLLGKEKPSLITEIGAGDGWFMLQVARRLPENWSGTRVLLIDKQRMPAEPTRSGFSRLGWRSETLQADALGVCTSLNGGLGTVVVANLFLHHFSAEQLRALFLQLAARVDAFIAVEPRRSGFALAASRLVWVIGCNRVTRHDAPVSVRAGFTGRELTALWPGERDWALCEHRAGWFSHLFVAHRRKNDRS